MRYVAYQSVKLTRRHSGGALRAIRFEQDDAEKAEGVSLLPLLPPVGFVRIWCFSFETAILRAIRCRFEGGQLRATVRRQEAR